MATAANVTVLDPLPPPKVTLHPFPDAVGSDRNGPCIPCAPLNTNASPLIAKSLGVRVQRAVAVVTAPAVKLPLTARYKLVPFRKVTPAGPCSPGEPSVPLIPLVPLIPFNPGGPCAPLVPLIPFNPGGPCAPLVPLNPLSP